MWDSGTADHPRPSEIVLVSQVHDSLLLLKSSSRKGQRCIVCMIRDKGVRMGVVTGFKIRCMRFARACEAVRCEMCLGSAGLECSHIRLSI